MVGASLNSLVKASRETLRSTLFVSMTRYLASTVLLTVILIAYVQFGGTLTRQSFIRGAYLQSIMPPAVTCIVLGKTFRLNEPLIASTIAVLSIISLLLAPLTVSISLEI